MTELPGFKAPPHSEAEIQNAILLELGARKDVRLWRINAGMGWVELGSSGKYRPQRFVPAGWPDLMGCVTIERAKPEDRALEWFCRRCDQIERGCACGQLASIMMRPVNGRPRTGEPIAVWLGVEVKSSKGRQSPEQKAFQGIIERQGGIYLLVRSVIDAERQLNASIDVLRFRIR